MTDMVAAPPHYLADPSGVECIDVIELMASPVLANAVKYLWRHDGKGKPVEDCEKAQWYIARYFGQQFKHRYSLAYRSDPFKKWRFGTSPTLRAASITLLVMLDSGKMPADSAVESALLEMVDEIRVQAAWASGASETKPFWARVADGEVTEEPKKEEPGDIPRI